MTLEEVEFRFSDRNSVRFRKLLDGWLARVTIGSATEQFREIRNLPIQPTKAVACSLIRKMRAQAEGPPLCSPPHGLADRRAGRA